MTLNRPWILLPLVTLALVFLPSLSQQPQHAQSTPGPYTLTDLGTLGGGSAHAYDMNQAGQITGSSTLGSGQTRAFRWEDGQMTNLGTLGGGTASVGQGINGLGDVVGYANLVAAGPAVATLWRDGNVINLTPDIPAGQGSQAVAINDHGQVLGLLSSGGAFLWQNGSRTPLGGTTFPTDLNGAGQAVGSSAGRPFLWQNGVMTDLGILPGDEDAGASGINSLGVIVGSSGRTDPDTYEQFYRPFIYENGVMRAISAPSSEAFAGDINDAGHVVGTMRAWGGPTPWNAWIYQDGVVTNLNSVKPAGTGLHLAMAQAINNDGQIAGIAMDSQGRYHGFLLTPGGSAPPPVVPTMSINDVHVPEGRSGTTNAVFTVTLSQATTGSVRVNFMTANGSAIAGDDFNFVSGTLIFGPGETSKTITVAVNGDRKREGDETFRVNLTGADGATMFDGQGSGTIHNDDR